MSITIHERQFPYLGYQVRINPYKEGMEKDLMDWLHETKVELDYSVYTSGYGVLLDTVTFEKILVCYIRSITDEQRMLLKLTFV